MIFALPAIAAATFAGMDAITNPGQRGEFDPSAPGVSSGSNGPSVVQVARTPLAIDPRRRNMGVMPTAEQIALYESIRHVRAPQPIVARIQTPPPPGVSPIDLRPWTAQAGHAIASVKGGFCLAALYCMETGAGHRHREDVAGYNHNYGNQKNPPGQPGPAYFLVDSLHSLDFYPSRDSMEEGVAMWKHLLDRPHYNKPGMTGASQSLAEGDIVAFCAALGAGGYARSYRNENLLLSVYRGLVRNGAIDNGLGL